MASTAAELPGEQEQDGQDADAAVPPQAQQVGVPMRSHHTVCAGALLQSSAEGW